MDRMVRSCSVSPGTLPAHTTKNPVLVAGERSPAPRTPHLLTSSFPPHSNYATMRFEPEALHGANAGLNVARDLLEPIKKEFPWISYGDLWTLAGVAAIQEMSGPKVPWRPGRIDGFAAQATPDGRLPDATQGADHLRNVSSVWLLLRIFLTFCLLGLGG